MGEVPYSAFWLSDNTISTGTSFLLLMFCMLSGTNQDLLLDLEKLFYPIVEYHRFGTR